MTLFAVMVHPLRDRVSETLIQARCHLSYFPGDRWCQLEHHPFALLAWQRWVAQTPQPDQEWAVADLGDWCAVVSGHVTLPSHPQQKADATQLLRDFIEAPHTSPRHWLGQFAFVAWQRSTETLYLVRDPFGIETLYWHFSPQCGMTVANLAKTLVAMGAEKTPNPLGWASFFLWGTVNEPHTVFRNIETVPAGHVGVALRGESRPHWLPFAELKEWWVRPSNPSRDLNEAQKAIAPAVREAVQRASNDQQRSALLLSGGIDSGAIAGLLAEAQRPIRAYTLAFPEFANAPQCERPWAELIARHYGIDHHVETISEPLFWEELPRFLQLMDQPTIYGINMWFACRLVQKSGERVVLTGEGGDELFGGYRTITLVRRALRLVRALQRLPGGWPLFGAALTLYGRTRQRPKWLGVAQYGTTIDGMIFLRNALFLPEELCAMTDPAIAAAAPELVADLAFPDVDCIERAVQMRDSYRSLRQQFLRDSRWTAAAHGIELRPALLSLPVLSAVAPWVCAFQGKAGKTLLARIPSKVLPESVIARPKTGFATPVFFWLAKRVFHTDNFPPAARCGAQERQYAWWLYRQWMES